jgi:membrane-associated phospholipid phosphatase
MSEHAYTAGAMPRGRAVERRGRSGAAGALLLAGLCLAGLGLVWAMAELMPAVQVRDAVALRDFTLLSGPHVNMLADFLLRLLDPPLFTVWGAALVLYALARKRPRVALAVALVMGLAPLASELLKPLLAHPHVRVGSIYISPASWPSGHSTAAAALVLCALLVTPARLRPAVGALGAMFAAAVGCALLIRAWHMPSDVVGGYLMGALWMSLAVAGLRGAERRWPSAPPRRS